MSSKRIIIFVGLPGTGKGTLSNFCVSRLGWHQLSTGNLCRKHIADQTEIGKKIDFAIKSGKLVSDSIISEMVFDWLINSFESTEVVIFDGFPRTVAQANLLQDFLKNQIKGEPPVVSVVRLITPIEVVKARMINRIICGNKSCQAGYSIDKASGFCPKVDGVCDKCQSSLVKRPDDNDSSISVRLETYHNNETQLLKAFEQAGFGVMSLDANVPIETLFDELVQAL